MGLVGCTLRFRTSKTARSGIRAQGSIQVSYSYQSGAFLDSVAQALSRSQNDVTGSFGI